MASDFQLRLLELKIRNKSLSDSQGYLSLGSLSGQDEQDFYYQERQWQLVRAELDALARTGYTIYAMSPSAIDALKEAARQLNQLIKADAAARNILNSVASIMQSFVANQSQGAATSIGSVSAQPLARSTILETRRKIPALDNNRSVDNAFQLRLSELGIRNDALSDSQGYLSLVSLSGQDEQDFYYQENQWQLVRAELKALATTGHYGGATMSPPEIDALKVAARGLNQLINANAAVRNILNSVMAIMKSYVPSQSSAALAEPKDLPPKPLLNADLIAAEGDLTANIRHASLSGIANGRYGGNTPELLVELRVDCTDSIISADLSRLGPANQKTWVAAFRTVPDQLAENGRHLVATDRYGALSNGYITIVPVDETNIQVTLRFDHPLDGLPFGRNIVFIARFAGPALRELGLERETEKDVPLPPTTSFSGGPMNIEAALLNAGIAVISAGRETELPKAPPEGWSEKDLEELMFNAAQSPLERPEFAVHLLWLSKSNRPGLLGVMFDIGDDLPRQGLAVFAGEIANNVPPDALPRKLIQTAVHEIGHALNLAHRFEREVGRADSTSFMNYDWRYAGGGRASAFWQQFAYKFDPDEIAFLRHAPYPQIVPGGAPFRSVRYWADGNGGYSPYVPEQPLSGYKLELLGPPQLIFEFGQPVILGIRLTNQTGRRLEVPTSLLDPKAGLMEILIRRVQPGRPPEGPPASFVPITTRCFDISGDGLRRLEPNQSIEDNLQLTFGAAGFPFAEPGLYDITAVLAFYDSSRGVDFLAPSNTLNLRVAYPASRETERVAYEVLLRPDVGRWFALGSPTRLNEAREDVIAVVEKAKGKDPIAANIARTAMFGFARENDLQLAKHHAQKISPLLKQVFDKVTARQTEEFIEGLGENTKGFT